VLVLLIGSVVGLITVTLFDQVQTLFRRRSMGRLIAKFSVSHLHRGPIDDTYDIIRLPNDNDKIYEYIIRLWRRQAGCTLSLRQPEVCMRSRERNELVIIIVDRI
jgi:hypothetical protein